jgi:ABC-type nitrate/sulfonate/bicarbonate transport system substrate-binding protein
LGQGPAILRVAALLGAVGALLLAQCGRREDEKPIVVGVSALRISLPVFVAQERGLFAKHGLEVKLLRFDTAQPLADELAAGRIDAGGYVAFPILFGATSPPTRVRVLTAVVEDGAHPLTRLLVKRGSGIRGTTALRGRKIGILPTIAYRQWLEAILRHDGLALDEVTILPIAPGLEIDALDRGGVDALFTGDPMATAALARGVAELATETPDVPRVLGDPFLFGTFAVTDRLAPEKAHALRDALDEAIAILEAEPAGGARAMAPFVREGERPFLDRYPPTRFLRSSDVGTEKLQHALRLAGGHVAVADVTLP